MFNCGEIKKPLAGLLFLCYTYLVRKRKGQIMITFKNKYRIKVTAIVDEKKTTIQDVRFVCRNNHEAMEKVQDYLTDPNTTVKLYVYNKKTGKKKVIFKKGLSRYEICL